MRGTWRRALAAVAAGALAVTMAPVGAVGAAAAAPAIGGLGDVEYLVGSGDQLVLPDATIGDGNYADGILELRLPGATADEALSLLEADAPSTVDGEVSVVDGRIYQGRDGEAVEIAGATVTRSGGAFVLRIGFATPLENNDFAILDDNGWPAGWTVRGASAPGVPAQRIVLGPLASRTRADRTQAGGTFCAGTTGPVVPGCVRTTSAPGGGYTVTGIDARSNQPYEFWTDVFYNPNAGAGGWGNNGHAWSREGDERGGSFSGTVSVDPGVLRFSSNATCQQSNPTYSSYCSMFGPESWSPVFTAEAGQALSFDWTAQLIADDYEIYAYLVEVPDATTLPTDPDAHTVLAYGRGANQPWTTTSGVIPDDGQYRFRFVNGSYDRTGGYALGSRLAIRNVRVVSADVAPDVVQQIARLVQYRNDDVDLVTGYERSVQLSLTDRAGDTGTGSLDIEVQPDPDAATITTQPGDAVAGEPVAPAPVVHVVRESGATVVGRQVTAILEGDATFAPGSTTTVVTNADGDAVFDDLVVEAAGTYTIRFVVRGQDVDTSASFTVDPAQADPASTTIEVSDADLDAGGTVTVTARFRDRFGNPTSDAEQDLTLTTDLGTFAGGVTTVSRGDLVEEPAGVFTTTLSLPRAGTATITGDGVTDAATVTVAPRPAGAPTDLDVERGDQQAELTWTAPEDGGSDITGYLVERSSDGGQTWTTVVADTGSDATSSTVTGLENGASYVFRVSAITAAGTGATSSASPVVVPATVPDATTDLTTVFGDGSVALTWSAPAFDGGSAITGHLVEVSDDDGVTWTTAIADTGSDATAVTVDGLTNGRDYRFRVTAINDVGVGAVGGVSDAVRPRTIPGAPGAVTTTAGDAEVSLSWSAPSVDGGAAVTGYRVEVSNDAGASWSTVVADTGTTATARVVDGLTNGSSYRFRVTAINEIGLGAAGTVSAAIVPFTVPDAPTAVAGVRGNGQVTLTWQAPAFDGGSPVTGYRIQVSGNGGDTWSDALTTTDAATTATVFGLSNGSSYRFRVLAVNARGAGPASDASTSVRPITVPGSPRNLVATYGDGEVSLTWQQPITNGGDTVAGYRVEVSTDGGATWTVVIADTGTSVPQATVGGLTNGTSYRFRVSAINDAGAGTAGAASVATTPRTIPGVAEIDRVVVGSRGVTFEVVAPVEDGGTPITGYEYSLDGGRTWQTLPGAPGRVELDDLRNHTGYELVVRAVNAEGYGPATTIVTVVPQPAPQPEVEQPTPARPTTTVDGREVEPTRSVRGGRTVELAAGGTSIAVTGRDDEAAAVRVDRDGRVRTREGGSLSVTGGGFAPDTDVDVWLLPSGRLLGEVAIGPDGAPTGAFSMPQGLAPGEYVVQVTGVAADGSVVTYSLVVVVQGEFVPGSTEELCLPTAGPGSPDFEDIEGSLHRANIRCMAAHGLTEGVRGGDEYAPSTAVSRAQMASFIARFLERTSGSELPRTVTFGDVDGGPHAANIEKLASIGVVVGVGDGVYAPNAPVSRAQMASFVHRALSWLDSGDASRGTLVADRDTSFGDLGTSGTHTGNVRSLAGVGIVQGYPDGTYRPADAVTRAQMASYVMRAYAWSRYELGVTR